MNLNRMQTKPDMIVDMDVFGLRARREAEIRQQPTGGGSMMKPKPFLTLKDDDDPSDALSASAREELLVAARALDRKIRDLLHVADAGHEAAMRDALTMASPPPVKQHLADHPLYRQRFFRESEIRLKEDWHRAVTAALARRRFGLHLG